MAKLYEPISIGTMKVRNRIVAAPTYCGYADEKGYVTQRLMDIYEARAQGGTGLVVVEAAYIRPDGNLFPRMLGVCSDRHITGLAELAHLIREAGASSSLQILFGGRASPREIIGTTPLAPSEHVPWGNTYPRALTTEECERLVDDFASAALRVKLAGFDSVMIHGCHTYLINQFLSPFTNKRKDRYGQDRHAFLTEVFHKVKQAVGDGFPISVRINGDEFLGEKGITLGMVLEETAPLLERLGVDCIDVSAGIRESLQYSIQPLYFPRGVILHLAEEIKKRVKVPVVGVGRINDPKFAERVVEDGRVDMVAFSRGLFADPELPKKAMEGRHEEVRKCIACDACMIRVSQNHAARCAVNPSFGFEEKYRIRPARRGKRVLVIGGGVGGMEAVRVASLRGHEVILFEREERLGGFVNLASSLPRLYTKELYNIVEWLTYQLGKLRIKIELGQEASLRTAMELKPEVLIMATGSLLEVPGVEGIEKPWVKSLDDYLSQRAKVEKKVIVLGAAHGTEAAVSLAREKKKVTLLAQSVEELAENPYIYASRRRVLQEYVQKEAIETRICSSLERVEDHLVSFVDEKGKREALEADTLLLATRRLPNDHLAAQLKGGPWDFYQIGDCLKPRSILAAIHEAAFVAREI